MPNNDTHPPIITISGHPNVTVDIPAFIQKILTKLELTTGQYDFTFVNQADIIKLNKTHLNRTYSTDIITFNLEDPGEPIIGDIYICTDQAKLNAIEYNQPYDVEIKRLIIHGILHLIGYEDYTDTQKKEMDQIQESLLEWAQNDQTP